MPYAPRTYGKTCQFGRHALFLSVIRLRTLTFFLSLIFGRVSRWWRPELKDAPLFHSPLAPEFLSRYNSAVAAWFRFDSLEGCPVMSRRNLAWLLGVTAVALLGLTVSYSAPPRDRNKDYELAGLVIDVLKEVDHKYVNELDDKRKRKLVEDMINGGL